MPNLGDIDAQTISGAISTGTHGTGARPRRDRHPGDRRSSWCSPTARSSPARPTERPDLFDAARVSHRRARRALDGDAAVRAGVHAGRRRAADAARGGSRAVRRVRRGQRPLRVLLVPLRQERAGQAEQPDRPAPGRTGRRSRRHAGLAAVPRVRGDGERRLRRAVPDRPGGARDDQAARTGSPRPPCRSARTPRRRTRCS